MFKGWVVTSVAMVAVCTSAAGMLFAPQEQAIAWRIVMLVALIVGTGSGAHRALSARHFGTAVIAAGALLLLMTALVFTLLHRR
jgi:hypothetical protein